MPIYDAHQELNKNAEDNNDQTQTQKSNGTNVSSEEIKKFNQLAARWWDTQGELWTLHQINPLRCQFIDKHCQVANKTILDVGCGGGILTEALAQRGASVSGIDLSPDLIQTAKMHALESQLILNYQTISVEEMAAKQPNSFDHLTCMEMLEHVPDPSAIVHNCSKLVKPQGLVFFSTLNRNLKSFTQAILGAEYLLNIIPRGTHTYEKFIKPAELSSWCRAASLQVLDIAGISYNPITKQFGLTSKPDVNYLICAQKN